MRKAFLTAIILLTSLVGFTHQGSLDTTKTSEASLSAAHIDKLPKRKVTVDLDFNIFQYFLYTFKLHSASAFVNFNKRHSAGLTMAMYDVKFGGMTTDDVYYYLGQAALNEGVKTKGSYFVPEFRIYLRSKKYHYAGPFFGIYTKLVINEHQNQERFEDESDPSSPTHHEKAIEQSIGISFGKTFLNNHGFYGRSLMGLGYMFLQNRTSVDGGYVPEEPTRFLRMSNKFDFRISISFGYRF